MAKNNRIIKPLFIVSFIPIMFAMLNGTINFFVFLPLLAVVAYMVYQSILKGGGSSNLSEFEKKMKEGGYNKRIVVYDLLSELGKINASMFKHWWTVGIWINYNNQHIALRTNKNTWEPIYIPFNKIQSVEMMKDGYTKISGGAVGYGGFAIGSAKSSVISKGLQIRIVTGDLYSGTQPYFLNLYDPEFGAKLNESDNQYQTIQECARLITDEIINIINNTK